jgi:histidyl-tRNA synthetase
VTASLSGFPELLPAQRAVELDVLDRLRRVFELHGFASVETRAAEPLESLLRKGEIDKEVYVLRRLHAGDDPDAHSGLGLHFDLTVPFARYVLDNAGRLEFPFRRYQIQKVWRGERPQEGRYREFTQADIDVIARDELAFHHDVQIARVMAEALASLEFLPPLRLQINNRKLMEGFCLGLGVPQPAAVLRTVDRLDKVPAETVRAMLRDEAGLSAEQAEACLALADINTPDSSFVGAVRELGVHHELLDAGLSELRAVIDGCAGLSTAQFSVQADLRIARGLDYYTGTVFETRMADFEQLGSICSGGRYDALATDGKVTYPGVGISLGVTRMLFPLFQRGALTSSRSVPSAVFVALPGEDDRDRCAEIAQQLRRRGIACEVADAPQKYGRQIRAAQRRGIPFVWFPGADGQSEVRDIRSGAQVPADPAQWRPPDDDLRPRTITDRDA